MRIAGAFFFLAYCTAKNKVLRFVMRLKKPRYLISAIVTIAYFIFVFGRNRVVSGTFSHSSMDSAVRDLFSLAFSLFIVAALIVPWAFFSTRAGLDFSESEIQFLFPAPLARWELLFYKVIRTQLSTLFSAAIFFLILRSGRFTGIWVCMFSLGVYFMMVRFARARLSLMRIGFLPRLAAVLAAGAAIVYALYASLDVDRLTAAMKARTTTSPEGLAAVIRASLHQPALSMLRVPLAFAHSAIGRPSPALLLEYAIVLLFAAACFVVTVRLDLSFEDASIELAKKKAEARSRRDAIRSGQRAVFRKKKPPFDLQSTGHPAVALFWKNLIAAGRTLSPRLALLILSGIFVAAIIAKNRPGGAVTFFTVAGVLSLVMTCISVVLGPLIVRNDLRGDLPHFDVLKAMPLTSQEIIAGEIAAPWIMLCATDLFALLLACAFLIPVQSDAPEGFTFFYVAAAYIVVVPFVAVTLLIQNAWVVVFPAWNLQSKEDARGFATSGSRMLLTIGHVAMAAIALIPAALAFAVSYWAMHFFVDSQGQLAVLAAIPAAAILAGEAYLMLRILAGQFEEMDVSNDLSPAG